MADLLLPEATDLESLQLIRVGGSQFMEQFWHQKGWAIRQPVVSPTVDARDITDIATELARRTGTLAAYAEVINKGRLGIPLRTDAYDYALRSDPPPTCEQIWNSVAKSASHELSEGKDVHDIEWFKIHGFMLRATRQVDWYLYPEMKRRRLRFELPYQERLKRHGAQLGARLHEIGIDWWDRQLEEYEPMPSYVSFPQIWIDYVSEVGRRPEDFPFWALTARSMQYAWGANVTIPMIHEVAQNVAGHRGVVMNRSVAKQLGIADGDDVIVESATGLTGGVAELREGIRPDTVLMVGQFDHWATPVAKDMKLPSLNSLTDIALSLTDNSGSSSDLARVSVRKVIK